MKAIVIKPKLCCGWSGSLGKIIDVFEFDDPNATRYITCDHCGHVFENHQNEYYVVTRYESGRLDLIHKIRVKILPDDSQENLAEFTKETLEDEKELTV